MKTRLSCLVALLMCSFTLVSTVAVAPASAATTCPGIYFYGARGSGEYLGAQSPTGDQVDSLGIPLTATYRALVAALPGVSIQAVGDQYPAVLDLNEIISLGASYYTSVNTGVTDALHDVLAEAQACPNTKLVIAGYSQGADVIRRTIASPTFPTSLASRTFVLLFGDPNFHSEPVITSGAGSFNNQGVVLDGVAVGLSTIVPVPPLNTAFHIEDYCHINDAVCQFSPVTAAIAITSGLLGQLNQNEPHLTYPEYDGVPSAWRIIQYFGLQSSAEAVPTVRMTGVTCTSPGANQANFLVTNNDTSTGQAVTLTATFFNVFGSAEETLTGTVLAGQTAPVSLPLPDALTSSVEVWASASNTPAAYDSNGNLVPAGQLVEHQMVPAAC